MLYEQLVELSPLYEFWNSDQTDDDEKLRLLKANQDKRKAYLYINEPYKWEQLYQSVLREIINGDEYSVKGLVVLLHSLSPEVYDQLIDKFKRFGVFNEEVLNIIKHKNLIKIKTNTNYFRLIRILFAIFTNPYGINNKRPKSHLYERTGSFFYSISRFHF